MSSSKEGPFDAAAAAAVVRATPGLSADVERLELVRATMTVVFRCGARSIKVIPTSHRSAEDVELELQVVNLLRAEGVPIPEWEKLYRAEAATVVVSEHIEVCRDASWAEIGELVAHLHSIGGPDWLPVWGPRATVYRRRLGTLQRNGTVNVDEHTHLVELIDGAERASQSHAATVQSVFTHGDLHTGNVLATTNKVWLIDWEKASAGPSAVDTTRPTLRQHRFGLPPADAAEFWASYDRPHPTAAEVALFDQLLVIAGITYLLSSPPGPQHDEGRRRLADSIAGRTTTKWSDI